MNVDTGEVLSAAEFASKFKDEPIPDNWVQVSGLPETVDRLSRSVQRDATVQANRKARRKAQKASRRRNR